MSLILSYIDAWRFSVGALYFTINDDKDVHIALRSHKVNGGYVASNARIHQFNEVSSSRHTYSYSLCGIWIRNINELHAYEGSMLVIGWHWKWDERDFYVRLFARTLLSIHEEWSDERRTWNWQFQNSKTLFDHFLPRRQR